MINKNTVLVIQEKDKSDNERSVIGVANSVDEAKHLIKAYYGIDNHKVLKYKNIQDGNLEFEMTIEVYPPCGGLYYVWAEWFSLNKA